MVESLTPAQLQPRGFLLNRKPDVAHQTSQLFPGDEVSLRVALPGFKVWVDDFRTRPQTGKVLEANEDGSYSVLIEDGRTLDFYRWELIGVGRINGDQQPQDAGADGRTPAGDPSPTGSIAGSVGGTTESQGSL